MKSIVRHLKDYQTLPDALSKETNLLAKINHFKVAIFLDYDGTLTPIVPHPEEALVSAPMRQTITALSQVAMVTVISGRNKSNIQELINISNIYYIGNHGFDIEGPDKSGIHFEVGHECLPIMEKCFRELQTVLMPIDGVQFEPKKLTVTIHYRFVNAEHVSLFFELMHNIVGKYPQLKISSGKKVLEIRPNLDWNKGRAMQWLTEKLSFNHPNCFIIYIGDDLTDEDAFRILPLQSAGILVGNHEKQTYADYHLQDPGEVKIFLEKLIASIQI